MTSTSDLIRRQCQISKTKWELCRFEKQYQQNRLCLSIYLPIYLSIYLSIYLERERERERDNIFIFNIKSYVYYIFQIFYILTIKLINQRVNNSLEVL